MLSVRALSTCSIHGKSHVKRLARSEWPWKVTQSWSSEKALFEPSHPDVNRTAGPLLSQYSIGQFVTHHAWKSTDELLFSCWWINWLIGFIPSPNYRSGFRLGLSSGEVTTLHQSLGQIRRGYPLPIPIPLLPLVARLSNLRRSDPI